MSNTTRELFDHDPKSQVTKKLASSLRRTQDKKIISEQLREKLEGEYEDLVLARDLYDDHDDYDYNNYDDWYHEDLRREEADERERSFWDSYDPYEGSGDYDSYDDYSDRSDWYHSW
jgi:hypothetical protein